MNYLLCQTDNGPARKEITKDSPEYAEFKDRAGLSESNFTLAQLFIDASCKYYLTEFLLY